MSVKGTVVARDYAASVRPFQDLVVETGKPPAAARVRQTVPLHAALAAVGDGKEALNLSPARSD
jgi:hypothetical protein